MNTIRINPPNSIIFILDRSNRQIEIPPYVIGELIAFNKKCISVGTLASMDGETAITLTDSPLNIDDLGEPVFDGVLEAPGLELSVCSSHNDELLRLPLMEPKVRVRIFVNDNREPDRIFVLAQPMPSLGH